MKLNSDDQKQVVSFAKRIDVPFTKWELLREALTHRSALNESKDNGLKHNERLEFLGDAVLELITTQYLFENYPDRPEGDLTSFRAALVRTESLAEVATSLQYGDYIFMSKGEEATGGRSRPYILANTFESVLGAMYLDLGFDECRKYLLLVLLPRTAEIVKHRLDIDAKSKLQEIAQDKVKSTPVYDLVKAVGPDHDKEFTMAVMIAELEFGKGSGRSKQEAEQNAASYALENWEDLYQKYVDSGKISPW